MDPPILKVYAYITHANRLLVFRHTHAPEAGIQVPGGSVEPGEPLDTAALREASEETGLSGLRLVRLLGSDRRAHPGGSQIYQRSFYHLTCTHPPPETWVHYEYHPSDGSPAPIEFSFFWAALPGNVPALAGAQDALLPQLIDSLKRRSTR